MIATVACIVVGAVLLLTTLAAVLLLHESGHNARIVIEPAPIVLMYLTVVLHSPALGITAAVISAVVVRALNWTATSPARPDDERTR